MSLTLIPTRTAGSLGQLKTNTAAVDDPSVQHDAAEWNFSAATIIQLCEDVGVDSNPAAGSLKQRVTTAEMATREGDFGSLIVGDHTLSAADEGKILGFDAAAARTLTIPVGLPDGARFYLIRANGTFPIQIRAGAGHSIPFGEVDVVDSGLVRITIYAGGTTSRVDAFAASGTTRDRSVPLSGSQLGTSPQVLTAVYLEAGTLSGANSRALIGTSPGDAAILEIRSESTGVLLDSFTVTGAVADTALGADTPVVTPGWHTIAIRSDDPGATASALGLRMRYT